MFLKYLLNAKKVYICGAFYYILSWNVSKYSMYSETKLRERKMQDAYDPNMQINSNNSSQKYNLDMFIYEDVKGRGVVKVINAEFINNFLESYTNTEKSKNDE